MKYDVVIIGAGSCGSILANELSADPNRSVLLLEAGPDYPDFAHLPDELKYGYDASAEGPIIRTPGGHPITLQTDQHNWQYVARSTSTAPPMPIPRGKVTGGSSAVNFSGFHRGVPEDFDAWASMGNDQWSFDQVLPYYRKIETDVDFHDDYHGTDGPIFVHHAKKEDWHPIQQAFFNACLDAGFPEVEDHNAPYSTGVGPSINNNHNRVRFSTALGYLDPARHRLNLTVRPNCHVQRLAFDGNRATGVVVESGGETFAVDAGQVILSAGAVGTPQILMLSGVGPAEHLRGLGISVILDAPGVGQNLRDHPKVYVTWKARDDYRPQWDRPRSGIALRLTAPGSSMPNDVSVNVSTFVTERANLLDENRASLTDDPTESRLIEMMIPLLLPLSSGELRLNSTDPSDKPYLDYNYLDDPFDRQRMRDGIRLAIQLGSHRDFANILGERIAPSDADLESDEALDNWLMRQATTFSHISCTCKMGPRSDPMAVVDQTGVVYGLENLRIVDASIMPDLVRNAINPTVIMLGQKIADQIK